MNEGVCHISNPFPQLRRPIPAHTNPCHKDGCLRGLTKNPIHRGGLCQQTARRLKSPVSQPPVCTPRTGGGRKPVVSTMADSVLASISPWSTLRASPSERPGRVAHVGPVPEGSARPRCGRLGGGWSELGRPGDCGFFTDGIRPGLTMW